MCVKTKNKTIIRPEFSRIFQLFLFLHQECENSTAANFSEKIPSFPTPSFLLLLLAGNFKPTLLRINMHFSKPARGWSSIDIEQLKKKTKKQS